MGLDPQMFRDRRGTDGYEEDTTHRRSFSPATFFFSAFALITLYALPATYKQRYTHTNKHVHTYSNAHFAMHACIKEPQTKVIMPHLPQASFFQKYVKEKNSFNK